MPRKELGDYIVTLRAAQSRQRQPAFGRDDGTAAFPHRQSAFLISWNPSF